VFIIQFNPKHRVRQRLNHRCNDLDCFFLSHKLTDALPARAPAFRREQARRTTTLSEHPDRCG
jgi:hypothetical protein